MEQQQLEFLAHTTIKKLLPIYPYLAIEMRFAPVQQFPYRFHRHMTISVQGSQEQVTYPLDDMYTPPCITEIIFGVELEALVRFYIQTFINEQQAKGRPLSLNVIA